MKKNFKKLFGARICHYRNLNSFSQEELAELVGMSPNTISYIENGKNNISFAKLPIFAKALNVKIYQFFIDTEYEDNIDAIQKIDELLKIANKKQLGIILNLIKNILDT